MELSAYLIIESWDNLHRFDDPIEFSTKEWGSGHARPSVLLIDNRGGVSICDPPTLFAPLFPVSCTQPMPDNVVGNYRCY